MKHTRRLLEILARHRAQATFFPIGRNVRRHSDLVRRVMDAGHEVGLHDDHHLPPPLLPPFLFRIEFERAAAAVRAAIGAPARFYRPPFGVMTRAQAERVRGWGVTPVLGDVYPRDPDRPGTEAIVARTLAGLRPGSILILHEASGYGDLDRSQTLAAVDRILAVTAERGWRAVAVGALIDAAVRT